MARLPSVGIVSYAGILFPAPLKTKLRTTPIKDTSGRVVKYRRYSLTVDVQWVAEDIAANIGALGLGGVAGGPSYAGVPLDAYVQTFRRLLTTSGNALVVIDQGFGNDFVVAANQTAATTAGIGLGPGGSNLFGTPDIDFGPNPRELLWEPLGSNACFRSVWQCDFTVAECDTPAGLQQATGNPSLFPGNVLGEFSWGAHFDVGEEGTTRTISGQAEVLIQRTGQNISDIADRVRDLVTFPTLDGFHRRQSWRTSEDKRWEYFTITDTEIPSDNPLYPKMVDMDCEHGVSSSFSKGFKIWYSTFSGTITTAPGVYKGQAWLAFLNFVNDRLTQTLAVAAQTTDAGQVAANVIPLEIDIRERLFGRQVSFNISYRITNQDLDTIFAASGLFRPVPGTWANWTANLKNLGAGSNVDITKPRGWAGLGLKASDDLIVDFCLAGNPLPSDTASLQYYNPTGSQSITGLGTPAQASSWLEYVNYIGVERETNTFLYQYPSSGDSTSQETMGPTTADLSGNVVINEPVGAVSSVIGDKGESKLVLVMRGYATRVGYSISFPQITIIGGSTAQLKRERVIPSRYLKHAGDQPVYFAAWERVYYVPSVGAGTYTVTGVPPQFDDQQTI